MMLPSLETTTRLTLPLQKPLLHRDVFLHYIYPQIASTPTRDNWDNLADYAYPPLGSQEPVPSFEQCRSICEFHGACLQFSYVDGVCKIGSTVKLGHSEEPTVVVADEDRNSTSLAGEGEVVSIKSGWMLERLQRYLEYVPKCEEGEWVLP